MDGDIQDKRGPAVDKAWLGCGIRGEELAGFWLF